MSMAIELGFGDGVDTGIIMDWRHHGSWRNTAALGLISYFLAESWLDNGSQCWDENARSMTYVPLHLTRTVTNLVVARIDCIGLGESHLNDLLHPLAHPDGCPTAPSYDASQQLMSFSLFCIIVDSMIETVSSISKRFHVATPRDHTTHCSSSSSRILRIVSISSLTSSPTTSPLLSISFTI